jgi:phospholipid-binding lipoprotein MlaA
MVRGAALLALGLLLAGCADTTPTAGSADPGDPYESWNRQVFAMNQKMDNAVMKPAAEAYVAVVPEPARDGLHNFLTNLNSPVVFANDILQGEFTLAGETVGRFGLNSTLGLGGLVDLATPAGIPYHTSDFGQTLGVWGVGDEPYLVDNFMDPLGYMGIREYAYWAIGRGAANVLDERARNLQTLDDLEKTSLDLYASERSLYRQYRNAQIHHGKSDLKNLPPM